MTHRLVIAGVPRAGKTTLATTVCGVTTTGVLVQTPMGLTGQFGPGAYVRHTDDLIDTHEWSAASEEIATWFDIPGPWVIEGVAAVRALRKWLARVHPQQDARPCDRVIWLSTPRIVLTCGQARMAAGCLTVWREVKPALLARGVQVEEA